jgi:hypothetical protein
MGAEGVAVELNGEIVEQILAAIHETAGKVDDVLTRVKNIEGTIDVILNQQTVQGTELENLKTACNKRATHCASAFQSIRNEMSGDGRDGP